MQLSDDELELAVVLWLDGTHLQFERLLEALQYQQRAVKQLNEEYVKREERGEMDECESLGADGGHTEHRVESAVDVRN